MVFSGKRLRSEREGYYGLGMDVLVIGLNSDTRMRSEHESSYGCSGHRMHSEHVRKTILFSTFMIMEACAEQPKCLSILQPKAPPKAHNKMQLTCIQFVDRKIPRHAENNLKTKKGQDSTQTEVPRRDGASQKNDVTLENNSTRGSLRMPQNAEDCATYAGD